MTRILITGGLGLIGSEIADVAIQSGHHVTILDDGRASVVPYVEGALHIEQSVEDYGGTDTFDTIIHTAAPVGPVGILGVDVLRDMTDATNAACALSRRLGSRLVVLSSSEVYGATEPSRESLIVPADWSPRSEYAVGKIVTELIARRHYAETGIPTSVIRPWNVTGPRQAASKGFVFPRFAEAVVAGRRPTVYLPGHHRRSFMAASDVAELIVGLLANDEHWDSDPVDIATPGNACSMMELAHDFTEHPLSLVTSPRLVDPVDEHGPTFREAASGSKLPPDDPALCGWTPLAAMIDEAMKAAAGRLAMAA